MIGRRPLLCSALVALIAAGAPLGAWDGQQAPRRRSSLQENARANALSLPGNVTRSTVFDDGGRTLNIQQTLGVGGNAVVENYGQEFDYSTGRLHFIHGAGYTTELKYDGGGRLFTETRSGLGAYNYTYSYDNNDNRVSQTGVSPSGLVDNTYKFNSINQLTFINPGANQTAYAYDDAGNRTGQQNPDGTLVVNGFDRLNRLRGVSNNHPQEMKGPTTD